MRIKNSENHSVNKYVASHYFSFIFSFLEILMCTMRSFMTQQLSWSNIVSSTIYNLCEKEKVLKTIFACSYGAKVKSFKQKQIVNNLLTLSLHCADLSQGSMELPNCKHVPQGGSNLWPPSFLPPETQRCTISHKSGNRRVALCIYLQQFIHFLKLHNNCKSPHPTLPASHFPNFCKTIVFFSFFFCTPSCSYCNLLAVG